MSAAGAIAMVLVGCTTNSQQGEGAPGTNIASRSDTPTTVAGTKATGTPVKIGLVNMDTGATAIPEISQGAKLAANRINEHENGINGHVIDLVTCSTDGTPESSAACANKLVAEKVVVVIDSADLGTDAKIPILKEAGIPITGSTTLGTSQSLNQDAFFFAPPATTLPTSEVDLAAEVGAKKLTVLLPDVAQVPILAGLIEKQAQIVGITATVAKFDQGAPDFDAAFAAIKANGADAVATIATDDWCAGMIRSARSANFTGKLIVGLCSRFAQDLGVDAAKGIYALSPVWAPPVQALAPAAAGEVMDQFRAAMIAAGLGDKIVGLSWGGYVNVFQTVAALRTVSGELTAASITTTFSSLKNSPNVLGEPITCSPRPYPGFSGCTQGWLRFVTKEDGTAALVGNGFVKPKS